MNKAKYVVGRQCEQTSEYSATQLVSSIKHKLSHAIFFMKIFLWQQRGRKYLINADGDDYGLSKIKTVA